jgi:hypothetical protein
VNQHGFEQDTLELIRRRFGIDPEMLRWCKLGSEKGASSVRDLKTRMHKGMSSFATLLAKFDLAHPDFTQEESKIMDGITNHNKSPAQVMTALSSAELADSWQTFLKENSAFRASDKNKSR